tara:strand:- start:1721 stop:2461 length:741 start_codon:yes stop_codon:yes gene_type:complete
MIKLGLIGYPLVHSFSKKYFNEKFDNENIKNVSYQNYELKNINELKSLIKRNSDLRGLNVTIPYKEKVIKYLDKIDEKYLNIGAVNVIKIIDNKLFGINTDYEAFKITLKEWLDTSFNSKALILGTGGSSKSVSLALKELNIDHNFVSRKKRKNVFSYDELLDIKTFSNYKLIINTTPLGMYPKINLLPNIPYRLITKNYFLYDLVYNPKTTKFLEKGKRKGAKIKNGLEMLHLQAELSWNYWNQK